MAEKRKAEGYGELAAKRLRFVSFPYPVIMYLSLTPPARFSGRIVSIEVGTHDKETFSVHEPILTANSEFFKLALDKKWKEGQELAVKLPEDDADTFAIYVEWLYNENITVASLSRLAKMYVLGEKIQSLSFCDAILSRMVDAANKDFALASISTVNIIFEGTPTGSPARKLILGMWIKNGQADRLVSHTPHPDFASDLLSLLLLTHNDKMYHRVSRKELLDL